MFTNQSSKIWIPSLFGLCLCAMAMLTSCHRIWHEATHEYTGYAIDNDLARDSTLEQYLLPYRQQLAKTMDDTVALLSRTLTLEQPESTLGNFLADLIQTEAERVSGKPVDLAIQNYGGVRRNSLAVGPLRMGMIYELMPFDNLIVILELDAEGLEQLITFMTGKGGWPVSKAVRYQIRDGNPQAILVNNRPIEANRTYFVAMPDYIANGGDRCDFLIGYPRTNLGLLVRDAIIHHCRGRMENGVTIDAVLDGRITIVD